MLAVLDFLTRDVTSSPVTYLIIFGATAVDSFFPLVPSETIIITAGVLASKGRLNVELVIAAAAVGGFAGDNVTYFLGDKVGDPVADRFFRSDKARRRLDQAERLLQRHGAVLIAAARFIPGGRTATMFAAGTLEFAWRRFTVADAIAVTLWGTYAAMLGYVGGQAFEKSLWKPLAVAFGIAALIAVLAEVYRRVQSRRGRDVLGSRDTGA